MTAQTKSGALIDLVETVLIAGPTDAGSNVFRSRTWPLTIQQLATPAILIDPVYSERRQSLGRNAPLFNTTTTIVIRARVKSPAGPNDAGADANQVKLETLKSQIEKCLINNYSVMLGIQQFPSIDTEFELSSDAQQPIGELEMTVAMEFSEGPDDFAPAVTSPLTTITTDVDALAPYDATATYASPPFPSSVTPAPRTTGPDGRAEGSQTFTLPQ